MVKNTILIFLFIILTGQNSLASFMFGEIVTANHKPAFGNLMPAKIKILEQV